VISLKKSGLAQLQVASYGFLERGQRILDFGFCGCANCSGSPTVEHTKRDFGLKRPYISSEEGFV
jgi:hypothetical protein